MNMLGYNYKKPQQTLFFEEAEDSESPEESPESESVSEY
jgi:hypothetical protein